MMHMQKIPEKEELDAVENATRYIRNGIKKYFDEND